MAILSTLTLEQYHHGENAFAGAYGLCHSDPSGPSWFNFWNSGAGGYDYEANHPPAAGTFDIDILDSLDVVVGQVRIVVNALTPEYTHTNICLGTLVEVDTITPPSSHLAEWEIDLDAGDVELWFELTDNGIGGQGYRFIVNDLGTKIVVLRSTLDHSENRVVQITTQNCYTTYTPCSKRALNIMWRNRGGGNQNYVFSGKDEIRVAIGGSETFKDSDNILRYSSVMDVRDGRGVLSGFIDKSHVIYLKLLKASIQAWVWDESLDKKIPIVIDKEGFLLYQVGNNNWSYTFTFVYGEEIIIQNQ